MKVPFLDLSQQYESLRPDIQAALQSVLDRTAFAGGPFVATFEEAFAQYCECPHAVGLGSGTEAIWLALVALGIGPGDEVITVPHTFMATAEAITYCGATPVFVDIEEATYQMDPSGIESAITERTRAVIPVHLYGHPADMDAILPVARRHNLAVIEDACQAHGARYKGRRVGALGDIGCFSFYPGKNLGAYGEAGVVVTSDESLAGIVRELRDHGQSEKYHHDRVGWNSRMDGFQAAILSVKLRHLDTWNARRRALAQQYDELLADVPSLRLPVAADDVEPVYHLYVVRTPGRDDIMATLAEDGVGCGIHYPIPVHLQKAYASSGYTRGAFPVTERCAAEIISLPMFPELKADQVAYVAERIRSAVS